MMLFAQFPTYYILHLERSKTKYLASLHAFSLIAKKGGMLKMALLFFFPLALSTRFPKFVLWFYSCLSTG